MNLGKILLTTIIGTVAIFICGEVLFDNEVTVSDVQLYMMIGFTLLWTWAIFQIHKNFKK
jgi:hypothetical protein